MAVRDYATRAKQTIYAIPEAFSVNRESQNIKIFGYINMAVELSMGFGIDDEFVNLREFQEPNAKLFLKVRAAYATLKFILNNDLFYTTNRDSILEAKRELIFFVNVLSTKWIAKELNSYEDKIVYKQLTSFDKSVLEKYKIWTLSMDELIKFRER